MLTIRAVMGMLPLVLMATLRHPSTSHDSRSTPAPQLSPEQMSKLKAMVYAHGLIMAIVFAALLPIGAMIVYLPNFKGKVWLHAGWQLFNYGAILAGLGIGAWIATVKDMWTPTNGHPAIGLFVATVFVIQALTGFIHHQYWRTTHPVERRSTLAIQVHQWWGRMIIIIGIINGGLGMQLAGIVKWRVVAYSVIAGAFCLSWLGLAIFRATASHRWTPRNLERAVDAQGVLGGSADADGQRNVSDAGQSYHTAATTETGTEMKESSTRQVKARPQSIAW